MIKKAKDFFEKINTEGNVYLFYSDDVCEAAVEFLEDNGGCRDIAGILTMRDEWNKLLEYGIPVIKLDDAGINKQSPVLITSRFHQDDIRQALLQQGFENIEQIEENFALYLLKKLKNKRRGESTEFLITKMRNQLLHFVPRPYMEYLIFNILDHCNLNCKGCDHFACIADPYIVPYETVHNDVKRMAEIFHHDYIAQIAVMGGEPLLHPELLQILQDVRENFPYAIIRLTTNGLFLLKQSDEFWKVCRDYRITIVNTKYPINLDYERMKSKCSDENVRFVFFEGTGDDTVKTSTKKTISLAGTEDPVKRFAECNISNYGNFVMEGKFFGCPFCSQSYRIFNKKFNQHLRLTEKDYLDIYKVNDMQEIFEFAARPKPYCRYCGDLVRWGEWEQSKRDISEWV